MECVTWVALENVKSILEEGFRPSFREIEKTWPVPHVGEWVHFYGELCTHPHFGAAKAYGGEYPVGIVFFYAERLTFSNGDSLCKGNVTAEKHFTSDITVACEWVKDKHRKKYVEFQSWEPLHTVNYFYLPIWMVKSNLHWEFLLEYAPVLYCDYDDELRLVEVIIPRKN